MAKKKDGLSNVQRQQFDTLVKAVEARLPDANGDQMRIPVSNDIGRAAEVAVQKWLKTRRLTGNFAYEAGKPYLVVAPQ